MLSGAARQDLVQIWQYGAREWGEDQAQAYAAVIDTVITGLSAFPEAGSPRRYKGRIYRQRRTGSHAILYWISGSEIRIARVLHVRMDAPRHLR